VASAALYRRSALEDVGLFHSEYFCYYEDTDLAVRLVLHGYSTVYVHAAVAYHRGSHTGVKSSDFHVYHLRRNAEYLYWSDMIGMNALWHLPFHLLHETLAFGAAVRHGQGAVVLRAKRDALKNTDFILRARTALVERLRVSGKLAASHRELARHMRTGLPWFRLWRQ
jgi:GT2 family glycosyltransferase